jgi:hypothetical protein
MCSGLIFAFIFIFLVDLEVAELEERNRFIVISIKIGIMSNLVSVLGAGHNAKPVSQRVALQELLGQVLQIALGELLLGGDHYLGLGSLHFDTAGGQLIGFAVDFDPLVQERLLRGRWRRGLLGNCALSSSLHANDLHADLF